MMLSYVFWRLTYNHDVVVVVCSNEKVDLFEDSDIVHMCTLHKRNHDFLIPRLSVSPAYPVGQPKLQVFHT
jgi:hypothetical protein